MAANAPALPALPMAPILAICPPGNDPRGPVQVPAAHPLVGYTTFLGWVPVPAGPQGAAQVELGTGQLVAAFGCRLSVSQAPADAQAFDAANLLIFGLTGFAWTRILNEYVASGLLAVPVSSRSALIARLQALNLSAPAHLVLSAADLQLGEPTVFIQAVPAVAAQPGVAAVPARGRRGRPGYVARVPAMPPIPAVPGVPGRPALDPYLSVFTLLPVMRLEQEGGSPWLLLSYLLGALGPVHTQAERNRPGSIAQLTARALAAGAHKHFNTFAQDDHSLADNLHDYLQTLVYALPAEFLSPGVNPSVLRAELRDSIVYSRDADGRRSIEESRILAFSARSVVEPPSPLA